MYPMLNTSKGLL